MSLLWQLWQTVEAKVQRGGMHFNAPAVATESEVGVTRWRYDKPTAVRASSFRGIGLRTICTRVLVVSSVEYSLGVDMNRRLFYISSHT